MFVTDAYIVCIRMNYQCICVLFVDWTAVYCYSLSVTRGNWRVGNLTPLHSLLFANDFSIVEYRHVIWIGGRVDKDLQPSGAQITNSLYYTSLNSLFRINTMHIASRVRFFVTFWDEESLLCSSVFLLLITVHLLQNGYGFMNNFTNIFIRTYKVCSGCYIEIILIFNFIISLCGSSTHSVQCIGDILVCCILWWWIFF